MLKWKHFKYIFCLFILKKEDEDDVSGLPDVPLSRIFRMNSSEWPFMVMGCIGSLIYGGANPAFAVIFAEILGVSMIMLTVCVLVSKISCPESTLGLVSLLYILLLILNKYCRTFTVVFQANIFI